HGPASMARHRKAALAQLAVRRHDGRTTDAELGGERTLGRQLATRGQRRPVGRLYERVGEPREQRSPSGPPLAKPSYQALRRTSHLSPLPRDWLSTGSPLCWRIAHMEPIHQKTSPFGEVITDAFASEWIDAWNARDLDRIVSHYRQDLVLV